VAEELRMARHLLRLTQAQVAARACVSENTVYLAEQGRDIRLSSLLSIAGSLQVEIRLIRPKAA